MGDRRKHGRNGRGLLAAAFAAYCLVASAGGFALPKDGETDAAEWGRFFVNHYNRFLLMKDDTVPTPYGGSMQYDKLAVFPAMKRIWNGYAFAVDFREERSHWYSLIDQKETGRQKAVKQPGACANCHSGDAPNLIKEMGWEKFNATPYADISDRLHSGVTCNDCHNPATMKLRVTRPALANALAIRGADWTKASRSEMRTLVCAQCHVEYYFKGDNKILTFPWDKGMGIDDINAYYDEIDFKDFSHKESGAPILKMQHPETELASTGIHARSGVSCADCHMPQVNEGGQRISDHFLRSPLVDPEAACGKCHSYDARELRTRVLDIQDATAKGLRKAETALVAAIDAIVAAKAAGASDASLVEARDFQRKASMRWDFISSENSMGFHSPIEAARVVGDSLNYARMAQLSAERVLARAGTVPATSLRSVNEAVVNGAASPTSRTAFMGAK